MKMGWRALLVCVPGFDGVSPVFLLGSGGSGGGGHWILRDKDIEMYEYTFQFYTFSHLKRPSFQQTT
jgi:hypothetical protein